MQRYVLRLTFEEGPDLEEVFHANTFLAAVSCVRHKYGSMLKGVGLVALA